MTKKQYSIPKAIVGAVKKSIAAITSRWLLKNAAQLWEGSWFRSALRIQRRTVSACETGLTDVKGAPEEYLGIPAGFLIGGAAGVISSLWKVEDGATCLLMTKFYEHHLAGRRTPARSLKDAQQWLRSLTMDDLQQFSGEFENLYARYQALFPATGPDFPPFDSAFFWAAFVLTGV